MRRLLACALLLALVVSGTALAARGDPQRKITRADQARAKAIVLRTADLAPGFAARPPGPDAPNIYCKALDESDLTLAGEAESPDFQRGAIFIGSLANVYVSVADANAAWRRGTSPAGERCARNAFTREFAQAGGSLDSFGRVAFPRVAPRTVAYHLVVTSQGVPLHVDAVVLQNARAQAAVLFLSGFSPVAKAEQVRLARIVAARMATAMRG